MQVRGRGPARRLLHHRGDRGDLGLGILDPDDAVLVRLIVGHWRNRDVIAATLLVVSADHVGEAWCFAMMEHVGQKQGERLVADDLASAPHGMAEPERRLLPGEARLAGTPQLLLQERELVLLAAFGERALELELAVEMVLDDAPVAARPADEMLDCRGPRP